MMSELKAAASARETGVGTITAAAWASEENLCAHEKSCNGISYTCYGDPDTLHLVLMRIAGTFCGRW
jgi:hypothetical protein